MDALREPVVREKLDDLTLHQFLQQLNDAHITFNSADTDLLQAEQEGNKQQMVRAWYARTEADHSYMQEWDALIHRGSIVFDSKTQTFLFQPTRYNAHSERDSDFSDG